MARARATKRADASTPIPLQPVLDAKPTSTQPSPDPRSTTRSDLSTPTLSIRRSTTIPGAGRHGARQTFGTSTASTPSPPVTRQRGTTKPARSSPAEKSITASTSSPTMIDSAPRYRGSTPLHRHTTRPRSRGYTHPTVSPHQPTAQAPQARATRHPGAPTSAPKPTPHPSVHASQSPPSAPRDERPTGTPETEGRQCR